MVNVDVEKSFFAALDGFLPNFIQLLLKRSGNWQKKMEAEIQMYENAKVWLVLQMLNCNIYFEKLHNSLA